MRRAALAVIALAFVRLAAGQDAPTPTPAETPSPSPTPRLSFGPAPRVREIVSPASSLADVVRRQQEEKKKKRSLGVITNETLRKGSEPGPTPSKGRPSASKSSAAQKPTAEAEVPKVTESRDDSGRTEADWRRTVQMAQSRLERAEQRAKDLLLESRRLENDFYAWSDASYRDRVIKPAWDQALGELAKAQQEAEKARQDRADLEEEARKSNTPPGWLR